MSDISSGTYIIDSEYNILYFNQVAAELYPMLKVGEKCHKALMGLDSPCEVCPVLRGVKGPKTYMDPIRKLYEVVDAVDLNTKDQGVCHALVFNTVGQEEADARRIPDSEHKMLQQGVIHALAADFMSVYSVDLRTGESTVLRSRLAPDYIQKRLNRPMQYQEVMDGYIDHVVLEEDREPLRRVTALENIRQELTAKESFLTHFRIIRNNVLHYMYLKCVRIGEAENWSRFVMAYALEDEAAHRSHARQLLVPMNTRARRKVLIIDGSREHRQQLKEDLADLYDILEAEAEDYGLEILKTQYHTLALVLLEENQEEQKTIVFLQAIQKDSLMSMVPIIITGPRLSAQREEVFVQLGITDYFTRPFHAVVLRKRLASFIRLRESSAALSAIEFDHLTGMYTKRAFFHHAEGLLQENPEVAYDLLISDIDDFKRLNQRHGESIGDEILKGIARFLNSNHRDDIISCRFGPDQFVTLLPHEFSLDTAALEDRLKMMVSKAPVHDYTVKMAVYEKVDHSLPIAQLCDRLMVALRSVKHQYGRNVAYFDHHMEETLDRERRIEESMEDALEKGQFLVYYQPKHDLRTGRICGAEALTRWIHPEYGFMAPAEFIPVFEKNGFIATLDLYVWKKVCEDLKHWSDSGLPLVPISVNASRRDFLLLNDPSAILDSVRQAGISEDLLHVEVTESLYSEDEGSLISQINQVREAGFRIEMDDFGSGYSTLSALKKLPLDALKLDTSFTQSLQEQQEVVKLIIDLAHALGLPVIAEGVETADQLEQLRKMGCDCVQGFYYSRPLTRSGFEKYLARYMD